MTFHPDQPSLFLLKESLRGLAGIVIRVSMFLQVVLFSIIYYTLEKLFKLITLIPSLAKYRPYLMAYIPKINPDIFKQTEELVIIHEEYSIEIHKIVTEDQYILTAWRLLPIDPIKNKLARSREPIALSHGLLDYSFSWFINKERHMCLPYILADEGHDVWILNNRGSRFSIGHKTMQSLMNNFKYWQFSFDELAKYDIIANLKYVTQTTGHPKLVYIGHSQGSTQVYAHLCSNLSLQNYFRAFIGLGPAISIKHLESKFVRTLFGCGMFSLFEKMGFGYFFVFPRSISRRVGSMCYYLPCLYKKGLFLVCKLLTGFNKVNKLPEERIPLIVTHEPGGASIKTILHWNQFMKTGEFKKFDFGQKRNLEVYGQKTPPFYQTENLKNFTTPQYLFLGTADIVCNQKDSEILKNIVNKETTQIFELDDYAHLDYVWGVTAYIDLFPKLLKIIQSHLVEEKEVKSNGVSKNSLLNGKANGLTNGHTNGYTNGQTNGHTNGLTNGLTNGYHQS